MLIRPSALGDVCRTVPVLASLRRAFPGAEIDWLVQEGFEDAVSAHPALTGVRTFPRRRIAIGRLWRPAAARELARFLGGLRVAGYDTVIDCQGLGRSGFFAWCTMAPRRIGHRDARELGWLGVNERHLCAPGLHTVDRMLGLVEAAGVPAVRDMRLYTPASGYEGLDARLEGARYVVVAPTSRWPGKAWPAARFAQVVRTVLAEGLADAVVLIGAASERASCAEVGDLAGRDRRVVDLIGATSIAQLMAVVERSALVVGNDSAALHMAVGFDRPLVGLFGPTRVDLVGPYGREDDVIRAPGGEGVSHKDARAGGALMDRIAVEEVVEAVRARLASRTAGPSTPTVRRPAGARR